MAGAAGALSVLDSIRKTLDEKQLQAKIVEVGCIGPCYLEPLVDIQLPGRPRMSHANVTPEKPGYLVKPTWPATNRRSGSLWAITAKTALNSPARSPGSSICRC